MKLAIIATGLQPASHGEALSDGDAINPLQEDEENYLSVPPHPLGVRPLGNHYIASSNARESMGSFQILPDEAVIILLEYLDAPSLRLLGYTCKASFAFCHTDDLWKTLFIEWSSAAEPHHFSWRGSWRSTFLSLELEQEARFIDCHSLFSDVLYRPFQCAHTPLAPYAWSIPSRNAITRHKDLSPDEFINKWSDKPFVLTEPVRQWPVFQTWDTDKLLHQFSDVNFRAEAVNWPLKTYVEYMKNSADESPLYLFDRNFVEKMGLQVGREKQNASYWIPDCFGEDLFTVLNERRPDNRWLIVGPERSGSTFHKDPNATSAWNAVLRGSKYWIMFPTTANNPTPPGVFVSNDQSEVTSPLSIAEWLLEFHAEARRTEGCLEGICGEGEVLHVPSGWWHMVINLDESIAITQNFVPRSHLSSVLSFLRDKSDQVSGFKRDITNPYEIFVAQMKNEHPNFLSSAVLEIQRNAELRKRKWDEAIGGSSASTFSFGFGEDGCSDEEIP